VHFQYKLHPAAQEDYESSTSWYLSRNVKAAVNFVNAVEKALDNICTDPTRHRNEYKNYYEFNLHNYPFTIIYIIEESLENIVITAIYHQKRHPRNKYR
jgi:plasmid stabilization system protein ParE